MSDKRDRARRAVERLERVQSRVRHLARTHPSFVDELRRAFDDFPSLIARHAEQGRAEEGWDWPNPGSLERNDLSRLRESDYHTVSIYRLGGLADMGLARPFVPKPKESEDWKRNMQDYLRWARRFPATDRTRHTENPDLSIEALPPAIAEEFLSHAEAWVREHAGGTAASAESGSQADARPAATDTIRMASGDGEVPAGGTGGGHDGRRQTPRTKPLQRGMRTRSKADRVRELLSGATPYERNKSDLAAEVGYTHQSALARVKNFRHLWAENERKLAHLRAESQRRMDRAGT